jgi:hypothetical protein
MDERAFMTYFNDSTTQNILGHGNMIGVVVLNAEFANVKLSRWHGVKCLDVATLFKETLHLLDHWTGGNNWRRLAAVVVDTDDHLPFEVGDLEWGLILINGQVFGSQGPDTSSVRKQSGSSVESLLSITNVSKGDRVETTSDDLGGMDALQRREVGRLESQSSTM